MKPPARTHTGEVYSVDGGIVTDSPDVLSIPIWITSHMLQSIIPRDSGIDPVTVT